jgi:hypothetical protein
MNMAKNSGEIGSTGLVQFSGRIQEDFLRELRGLEGYKRFREMALNSPVVGALLLSIRMPILAMEWTPAADDENDPRLEIFQMALDNLEHSMQDHITECLSFLWAGYYPFEIVYERGEDGRMLWHKFAPRGQDTITRWQFGDNGSIEGFYQRKNFTQEVFIPIEKSILYRINVERNNPEGRSLLRPAWTSYYYAKYIAQSEAIGIERGMDGFPVITLPDGASTDDDDPNSDAAKAAEFVRNIRNDEQAGMVLPFGWVFELAAPGAQSRLDPDKVIRRYESRILMSALAQFLNLGQEGIGSMALSSDQTDFFAMAINATADVISDTITKHALPRLMKLNGYDAKGLRLTHTPATKDDITQVSAFLGGVSQFLNWSAEDEVWLRQVARLPERTVEDIQADMDEKAEQKEAMAEAFMDKRGGGKPGEKPGDKPGDKEPETPDELAKAKEKEAKDKAKKPSPFTLFSASAPDERKRRQAEKRIQEIVQKHMDRTKKKVVKYAKTLRH